MVRNKLAAAIAAIGALQAGVVGALGMGELTLNSALNQPLDAEIRLHNTEDLDRAQVLINMAGAADFEKAGLSRDYVLTDVSFNVVLDGKGGGVIKVTTREPIIEPYLNFLVDTRWPTGRMLREYTVLLDLPVFSESSAKPIAQAAGYRAAVSKPAAVTAPAQASSVATRTTVTPSARATATPSVEGDYRVRNDDTLWEIANNNRPASVSVQQTMVGIQNLNPQAFINGNINRLKAGSVLRMPSSADISVSARDAVSEVASQNRVWRQGDESDQEATEAQLDATRSTDSEETTAASEPRLSIAAGGSDDRSSAGDGSGMQGGSEALQNDLVAAQENLDKTVRENDELQSRLDDMEAKVATLQRLLELKDDQLAVMQDNVSLADRPLNGDGNIADTDSGAPLSNEIDPIADVSETQAEKDKKEQARTVITTKPAEKSLIDQLLENPLYTGGAGAVLLGLILLFIKRRKKSDDEQAEQSERTDVIEQSVDTPDSVENIELTNDADTDVQLVHDDDSTASLVAELEEELAADEMHDVIPVPAEETQEPVEAVESETADPIAEAEIYIAYGRYQQAIDLLRASIDKEPDRADLQAKLLEVYVETRDKRSFQQQFAVLSLLGNDHAVASVREMIAGVTGVSDWLDDADISGLSDTDMDADLIEGSDLDSVSDEPSVDVGTDEAIALEDEEEFDFSSDFDELSLDATQENTTLTLEHLEAPADTADFSEGKMEESGASEHAALGDDFELDLDDDLDLDELQVGDLSDLAVEFGDDDTLAAESLEDEFSLELDSGLSDSGLSDSEGNGIDVGSLQSLEPETAENQQEADLDFESDTLAADTVLADAVSSDKEALELDAFELDLDDLPEDGDFDLDFSELELDDSVQDDTAGDDSVEADTGSDDVIVPFENPASSAGETVSDDEESEDFDFLADTDEVATKLDLARAYIDMGDVDGARDILDEVKLTQDALIDRIE